MSKLLLILFLPILAVFTTVAQSPKSKPAPTATAETVAGAAADNEDEALIESIKSGDLPLVMKLLEEGADPDATDDGGSTALCWAVRMNRVDLVKALLARNAKVDQEESDGGTALHDAAAVGSAELVKLLLDHGAEVNHKDKGGHTALMIAAFGAMIKNAPPWLASALLGLDENDELFTRIGSEHNLAAQVLLKAGADVNAQAEDCGMNTLMVAALSGNAELARILLANKADVNIKNGERSALRYAQDLDSPESLQSELKDSKDNEERQTFLNWIQLTAPGRHEIARMLRKAGAKN